MKNFLPLLILSTIPLFAACGESPRSTPAPRTATIADVVNNVQARIAADKDFVQAAPGLTVNAGGQVRTGAQSRARVNFSEGSIVRLGENTLLTVENLSAGNALHQFQMDAGRIWVSIFGGTFELRTPVGIATVRGSFAKFELVEDALTADCYEGTCAVRADAQTHTLGNLERITLRRGRPEALRALLNEDHVAEFLRDCPECARVVPALTAAPRVTRLRPLTITPPLTLEPRPTPILSATLPAILPTFEARPTLTPPTRVGTALPLPFTPTSTVARPTQTPILRPTLTPTPTPTLRIQSFPTFFIPPIIFRLPTPTLSNLR